MRALAVDDDPQALGFLQMVLQQDHEVIACRDGAEALRKLSEGGFDLVITDLRMPHPDGFEVLQAARALVPPPAVVVLSAVDNARAAVRALRLGARDFLVKPAEPVEILTAVARASEGVTSVSAESRDQFGLVGDSAAIRLVRRLIPTLAQSREAVLIVGETGTGKELLARAIHEASARRAGPFVAHNMAATPSDLAEAMFLGHSRGAFSGATSDHRGLFEQADGGSLLLDEIDSFPFDLQAKLLRVLESARVQRLGSASERAVNVRVFAASSVDPISLVARGAFRADLYYRLRQLEVELPPLRERTGDIPVLARWFLKELEAELGCPPRLSEEAMRHLMAHPWPGNVRELRNTVRSAVALAGGEAFPEHLPRAMKGVAARSGSRDPRTLRTVEEEHILRTLESMGGNRSRAARVLGIDRGTLARKLAAIRIGRRRS